MTTAIVPAAITALALAWGAREWRAIGGQLTIGPVAKANRRAAQIVAAQTALNVILGVWLAWSLAR